MARKYPLELRRQHVPRQISVKNVRRFFILRRSLKSFLGNYLTAKANIFVLPHLWLKSVREDPLDNFHHFYQLFSILDLLQILCGDFPF